MYENEQINTSDVLKHPEKYPTSVLQEILEELDQDICDCMEDPITQMSGCGDEIGFDMRRKGSAIFNELCKRGVEEFDGDCMTESYWCPIRRP